MKDLEIYGTIGPSCADACVLSEMKKAGMTGLRINLSHGGLALHDDWLQEIRKAGIRDLLIDLNGPELRVLLGYPSIRLSPSVPVFLSSSPSGSSPEILQVSPVLTEALTTGRQLLIDDGKFLIETEEVLSSSLARCRVLRGGELKNRKSISPIGLSLRLPTLTQEDHENLSRCAKSSVTGVMLPFVRDRADILNLKEALSLYGCENIRIFAKIESLEGMDALPGFIRDVDHVVIARGDLGTAMPLWLLPGCQKKIAALCSSAGTPFMVVTQMLESMCTHPVPTRAEVSDIYNAVLDGASSLMLTGETAAGAYPVQAIEYLTKTARAALSDLTSA